MSLRARVLCPVFGLAVAAAAPAWAESSLGFSGALLEVASHSGSSIDTTTADVTLDFAVTAAHGLQFNLGAQDHKTNWRGDVGLHLYMMPDSEARYGFYVTYADLAEASAGDATAGIEAIVALGIDTQLEVQLGTGMAHPGSVDHVHGIARVRHALTPSLALHGSASLTDVNERDLDLRIATIGGAVEWFSSDQPVSLRVGVEHTHFDGRPALEDETVISLALRLQIGGQRQSGTAPAATFFTPFRPLAPLWDRDLIRIDS